LYLGLLQSWCSKVMEIVYCCYTFDFPHDVVQLISEALRFVEGRHYNPQVLPQQRPQGELKLKHLLNVADNSWGHAKPCTFGAYPIRVFTNFSEVFDYDVGNKIAYFAIQYDSPTVGVKITPSYPSSMPFFSPLEDVPIQKVLGIGSSSKHMRLPVINTVGISMFRVPVLTNSEYRRPIWVNFVDQGQRLASRPMFYLLYPSYGPEPPFLGLTVPDFEGMVSSHRLVSRDGDPPTHKIVSLN